MGTLCVVCRRRDPNRGQVCDADRARIAEQLTDLPRKMTALTLRLVPGQTIAGDRVRLSRTGSPTGARADALTLAGPGSDAISAAAVAGMLHPKIRRWRTTHTVYVTTTIGGQKRRQRRDVVQWHQELVRDDNGNPVLQPHDDQVGILPPAEWLDLWARSWRAHFDHHRPDPAPRGWANDPENTRRAMRWYAAHSPNGPAVVAVLSALGRAWRDHAAATVLGLTPGYGGTRPAHIRRDDPLADEWEVRFGEPPRPEAPVADVTYLLTWLDAACDADVGIADFAAELRALSSELTRVLGETPDQQWLGRCPSLLTDPADGSTRVCGAGLWQDPYTGQYVAGHHTGPAQVQCPRCHSTWGPRTIELYHLADQIRKTWPVDRRRRYTTDQVNDLNQAGQLCCPTCAGDARVTWRDVTATGDDRNWWRPDRVTCPKGCPEAERLI